MNRELYENGILRERADDTTRTVTTYDETGEVTSTRPYTDDENAAADASQAATAQAQVADTLTADTNNDEAKIIQAIEDLRIVLGDSATEGSLRQVRAAFNNQYSVATVRTLIDVLITQAQANRRIARQLLRVQRLATGDFDSADVGVE